MILRPFKGFITDNWGDFIKTLVNMNIESKYSVDTDTLYTVTQWTEIGLSCSCFFSQVCQFDTDDLSAMWWFKAWDMTVCLHLENYRVGNEHNELFIKQIKNRQNLNITSEFHPTT